MNLIEGLESVGIRWRKSGKPNEIWICCPYCVDRGQTPDTRFRLGVNISSGNANCFNCGWRRHRTALIQLQQRLQIGGWVEAQEVTRKKLTPIRLPEDFGLLDRREKEYWSRLAYKFVKSKGVTDEQIKRYRIGYSGYRVIVPVYYKKKLYGVVGRALKDSVLPKYKNSTGDKALFGIADGGVHRRVVINEGVFDAMACARVLVPFGYDCVAILGDSITGRQIDMLRRYKEFYIWLDSDAAGAEGASTIARQLLEHGTVKIVMPEDDDKDPDELAPKEIKRRIRLARRWSDALGDRLQAWIAFRED